MRPIIDQLFVQLSMNYATNYRLNIHENSHQNLRENPIQNASKNTTSADQDLDGKSAPVFSSKFKIPVTEPARLSALLSGNRGVA